MNDYIVIYIGYGKSRSEIMSSLSDLILNFKDYLIKELKHAIQELSTNRISIGPILTISELIYLVSKFLKDRKRKTILIIDEFRRIGKLSEVEQELELVSNDVAVIDYGFKKHGGSFKIICFTSDAIAQKLQPKLSSKCVWWIMWHLPKEDFYKALRELNCSIDYELLWKLTGGSLREIKDMLRIQWNVNSWIDRKIVIIHKLIRSYISSRKISKEEFIHEVKRFIDNINELSSYDFWKYLLKMNIVIEIDVRFNKLNTLPSEEWIGKYNAFQLPIYYWIFKTMYEERSIEITSNDILQIIKKSY